MVQQRTIVFDDEQPQAQPAPQQPTAPAPQRYPGVIRGQAAPVDPMEERRVAATEANTAVTQARFAYDVQQDQRQAEVDAAEAQRREASAAAAREDAIAQMQAVIEAAQQAKELSQNGWFATGFGAETARGFGGSSASNVDALLQTIGGNLAFDRLQAMRDASPTGGALGQVTERELALLQSTVAALNQTQSDEQFQQQMDRVIESYSRVLERVAPELNESAQPSERDNEGAFVGGAASYEQRFLPDGPTDDRGTPLFMRDGQVLLEYGENGVPQYGFPADNPDADSYAVRLAREADRLEANLGETGAGDLFLNVADAQNELRGAARVITEGAQGNFNVGENYQQGSDLQLLLNARARDRSGSTGAAAEFLGNLGSVRGAPGAVMQAGRQVAGTGASLSTPAGRAAVQAQMARNAGKEGALAGAVFGGFQGEGLQERASNALVGGVGGYAFGRYGTQAGNALANRMATPRTNANVAVAQAAERQGVEMLPADVGGTATRLATGVVRRTLGEIPIAEASQRSVASARAARDRVASNIGTNTDEARAGQIVRRGLDDWQANTDDKVEQMFGAIPIADDAPMVLSETRAALGQFTQGLRSNPELSQIWASNPRLQRTAEALANGQLSWNDAQRFRSIVGNIVGRPSLASEGPEIAQLRGLYAALTRDMEATAAQQGPRALTMWRRAVDYKRGREGRINEVLNSILGPRNNRTDEQVFERINSWAQRKGGDFRSIARLLRSLEPEEANTVRATLLGRMGNASAGRQNAARDEFSPAQFLTEWNGMSDRARAMLFPSSQHRGAIDDLVTIMDGMKRAGTYQNYSMTSLGTNALATGGLTVANPFLGALAAMGQLGAGKLLASQRFAQFLVRSSRGNMQPQAIQRQLDGMARSDPALAQELAAFRQNLTAMNDNANVVTGVAADEQSQDQQ